MNSPVTAFSPTAEERSKFRAHFGEELMTYWEGLTCFDVVRFAEHIWPEIYTADKSVSMYIQEKYGDEAHQLIVDLLEYPKLEE